MQSLTADRLCFLEKVINISCSVVNTTRRACAQRV